MVDAGWLFNRKPQAPASDNLVGLPPRMPATGSVYPVAQQSSLPVGIAYNRIGH